MRTKIYTKGLSKAEWLQKRTELGIGASEMATVLNLNPYEDAIRLFYMKIGRHNKPIRSEKMMMGNLIEPFIHDLWTKWVPDENEYLLNLETNKTVRNLRKVNAFTKNTNYPWLFASFDRMAPKGQLDVFQMFGEKDGNIPLQFPVQMKNTTYNSAKRWINGLPIYYYVQCQGELLVANIPYMEFCFLQDGFHLVNIPIQIDDKVTPEMIEAGFTKSFAEEIIEQTHDFWYNHVMPAKELVQKIELLKAELLNPTPSTNYDEINESIQLAEQAIIDLEPAPSNTEAYEKFMLDEYQQTNDKVVIEGTPAHYNIALAYAQANKAITAHTESKQLARNQIIAIMRESERIDFGDRGRIIWRRTPGKKAYFSVQVNE